MIHQFRHIPEICTTTEQTSLQKVLCIFLGMGGTPIQPPTEARKAVGGSSEMQFIFTNEEEYVIVATDIKKREKDGNHVAGPY